MDINNLKNVYNSNPTLQKEYSLNEYLNLFDQGSYTPIQPTPTDPTPTDPTPPNNGIIGIDLNQMDRNNDQGGLQALDPYSNVASSRNQSNNFLNTAFSKVGDFKDSMMDKFSNTKIGEGITSSASKFKNMAFTPMMALANTRNPLNPDASNYNPNLQGQLDYLQDTTGTKISGTYKDPFNKQLGFTDNLTGQAMIGRDPNSGLGKYGPGSVLEGQNVVSVFGTNDYEDQLQDYIDKMTGYKTKTDFQQKKIDRAAKELKEYQDKQKIIADKKIADKKIADKKIADKKIADKKIADQLKIKKNLEAKQAREDELAKRQATADAQKAKGQTTSGGSGNYRSDRDHSGDGGYGGSSRSSRENRSSDLGFSDIRLKDNIELVGKSPSDINIYNFTYLNDSTVYEGVMAQEVPWASVKHDSGYLMVDYSKVDVQFKKKNNRLPVEIENKLI